MPLPEPNERTHIHTRAITCEGYERADGLWDIDAHLTDVKTYAFTNRHRGTVDPGEPLHDMWLRVTVDDDYVIRDAVAVIDKSPFRICPEVTPNFKRLIGIGIGPGWRAQVKRQLGGVHGCTHLVELLGPVATTAFQTIATMKSRRAEEARARAGDAAGDGPSSGLAGDDGQDKPALLNTCYSFASDSRVVQELWPKAYTGDRERGRGRAASDPETGRQDTRAVTGNPDTANGKRSRSE